MLLLGSSSGVRESVYCVSPTGRAPAWRIGSEQGLGRKPGSKTSVSERWSATGAAPPGAGPAHGSVRPRGTSLCSVGSCASSQIRRRDSAGSSWESWRQCFRATPFSRWDPSVSVHLPADADSTAWAWLLPWSLASRYSKSAWPRSGSPYLCGSFRLVPPGPAKVETAMVGTVCFNAITCFLISSSGIPAISSQVRPCKTWSSTIAS